MAKIARKQHFVTFYSPGTFFDEQTTESVRSWDVKAAAKMAHGIMERYSATPFGFRFTTRGRTGRALDSKEIARSPMYYLGGNIRTAEQVLAGTDPKEEILRSNVRNNGIKRVIVNDNSWRHTGALQDDDVVLDWKPRKKKTKKAA